MAPKRQPQRTVSSFEALKVGEVYETHDDPSEEFEHGWKLIAIQPAAEGLHHAVFQKIKCPALIRSCTERTWSWTVPVPHIPTLQEQAAEQGFPLTSSQAAGLCGISVAKLLSVAISEQIPCFKIGRHHFYRRADIVTNKALNECKFHSLFTPGGDENEHSLTVGDAAKILHCTQETVNSLGRRGILDREFKPVSVDYGSYTQHTRKAFYTPASVKRYALSKGIECPDL